jgi:hypothetical protein
MCSEQMIGKVAGYQNFSLLEVLIILLLGLLLIILGFIDKICDAILRCPCCRRADTAGLKAWKDDDILELARRSESDSVPLNELHGVGAQSEEQLRLIGYLLFLAHHQEQMPRCI